MATKNWIVRLSLGLSFLAVGFVGGWWSNEWFIRRLPLREIERAYNTGQFSLCEKLARARLRETGDGDRTAALYAARSLAELKEWGEAHRFFSKLVLDSPADFAAAANASHKVQRTQNAVETCRNGLAAFPSDPRLIELQARLCFSIGEHRDALAAAERLKTLPGKEVAGHLMTGLIQYSTKNYIASAANLKAALQIDPELSGQSGDVQSITRAVALQFLSHALLESEKGGEAVEFATAAFAITSSAEDAWLTACCHRAADHADLYRQWIKTTLDKDPRHLRALVSAAEVAFTEKNDAEALRHLDAATAHSPNDKQALLLKERIRRRSEPTKQKSPATTTPTPAGVGNANLGNKAPSQ